MLAEVRSEADVSTEVVEKFIHHNACTNGDVKRVLGTVLRQFEAIVTEVDGLLAYAHHFMAKNEGKLLTLSANVRYISRSNRIGGLLDGDEGIASFFQAAKGM